MATAYESITDAMAAFVERQHVFFVATAPSGDGGRVNVSPKGLDSFRILGPNRVAYLDLTGSGAETIAHVRQNGRITFMFCAFEGKPDIIRFYGQGEIHRPGDPLFAELVSRFSERPGIRSVITADIDRSSSSCGFAVPKMNFVADRDTLTKWTANKSSDDLADYWAEKNATSIDGLPAVTTD
jgi:hypothetical protein